MPKVTSERVLLLLSDGRPRCCREITVGVGMGRDAVDAALMRLWRKRWVLRTAEPLIARGRFFRGRAGFRAVLRQYHLYMVRPSKAKVSRFEGHTFVVYGRKYLDRRGGGGKGKSKARAIFDFLKKNCDRAFFSKEVLEALKEKNVKPSDIMTNVRRFEKDGLVYVRGYRCHDKQTPFKDGYLLTWIDSNKPREQAIEEAIKRTNKILEGTSSTSPIIERIHVIRDQVLGATKLRDLVSFEFIQNKLGCTLYEAEGALARALQLYPDLKVVKLFDAYNYYYHESLSQEDLKVAITFKQNYVRRIKGSDNRIGHNWEGCVEWFIDKFTLGAVFQTQKHRTEAMDPRRITLHLVKSVGERRQNAEVDRVWSVTPSIFAQPITYVLECKWGLVQKRQIDDFLEVLKWSTEFGANTTDERTIKQGIIGVFAGSAFNPKEKVKLKDGSVISLASYAARINIQLLKASDFNEKLRERGVPKEATLQRVCRVAKNEKEVRECLSEIWENPIKSNEIISKVIARNSRLYEFEKMLESSSP